MNILLSLSNEQLFSLNCFNSIQATTNTTSNSFSQYLIIELLLTKLIKIYHTMSNKKITNTLHKIVIGGPTQNGKSTPWNQTNKKQNVY